MRQTIINQITDFVKDYKIVYNTATDWEEPLVAFADANDPLFIQLKDTLGATHAIPTDFIEDAKTVIVYFIPFKKEVNLGNSITNNSSKEWAAAYIETNKLITDINAYIYKKLSEIGYKSTKLPPTHNFDEEKLISNWSHKHVAYIAGLGKFGLHQMLITDKGCSGRLGSIITNIKIEPTKRLQKEYCLHKHNKTCKKCVVKCINGALKIDSFDRHKCYENCLLNAEEYTYLGLADVCGKCVNDVPCSFSNPLEKLYFASKTKYE